MNRDLIYLLKCIILSLAFRVVLGKTCNIKETFVIKRICELDENLTPTNDDAVYIIYSVNPVEGFNLRRDVYIRMAVFMKNLRKLEGYENAHLVLPVFHHLYPGSPSSASRTSSGITSSTSTASSATHPCWTCGSSST